VVCMYASNINSNNRKEMHEAKVGTGSERGTGVGLS